MSEIVIAWDHSKTKIPVTIGKGTDTDKPRPEASHAGQARRAMIRAEHRLYMEFTWASICLIPLFVQQLIRANKKESIHQRSTFLTLCRGIHQRPIDCLQNGAVIRNHQTIQWHMASSPFMPFLMNWEPRPPFEVQARDNTPSNSYGGQQSCAGFHFTEGHYLDFHKPAAS